MKQEIQPWRPMAGSPAENAVTREMRERIDKLWKDLAAAQQVIARVADVQSSMGRGLGSAKGLATDALRRGTGAGNAVDEVAEEVVIIHQDFLDAMDEVQSIMDVVIDIQQGITGIVDDVEAVQQSANGKATVTHSTTPRSPGAAGSSGDVHYTWGTGAQANIVVRMQIHDGTRWVDAPLSHHTIASLDVGKVVAGMLSGVFIEAQTLLAEHVVIAPGNIFPDPYFRAPEKWNGAGISVVDASTMPGGKALRIQPTTSQRGAYYGGGSNWEAAQVEPGETYLVRATVRSTTPITATFRFFIRGLNNAGALVVVASKHSAADPWIPTGLSAGTRVYETEITVPSTMQSGRATMGIYTSSPYTNPGGPAYFAGVSVSRMTGSKLVVKGAIVSDSMATEDFFGLSIKSGSFIVLDPDTGREWINLDGRANNTDGNFITVGSGALQTTIGNDGVSSSHGSFDTLEVGGLSFDEIQTDGARGVVARSAFGQFRGSFSTTTEQGITELRFTTPPGGMREYRFQASNLGVGADSTDGQRFRLRMTFNGSRPTTSSTDYVVWEAPLTATAASYDFSREYAIDGNTDVRILLTISPRSGTGYWDLRQGMELSVIDEGAWIERTGRAVTSAGGGQQAPSDPIENYVKDYAATWSESYNGSDASNAGLRNAIRNPNSPFRLYQGRYNSVNGTQRSLVGFPSMASDLSGATIQRISVYLYFDHWYRGTGGRVGIGTHTHSSRPSSLTSGVSGIRVSSDDWPRGAGRWVTLPSSTHAGFASGSVRGIALLAASTSTLYYGNALPHNYGSSGHWARPKIRVRYRK